MVLVSVEPDVVADDVDVEVEAGVVLTDVATGAAVVIDVRGADVDVSITAGSLPQARITRHAVSARPIFVTIRGALTMFGNLVVCL